jgi:class 3 adenylate cyclase
MFQSDRLRQDWQSMRALLHEASRLESLAAVGRVLTPDELVEAIQTASADRVYAVKTWRVEALGQRAGIADGRVRYRLGPGGFTDESRVWVATERDQQIWRMRIFRNRRDAIRCFGEHGLDLEL